LDRVRLGLTLLRVVVALLMLIHGVARAYLDIVDDFGVVLGRWGFPRGHVLAWTLTGMEIGGGLLLALGWLVRPLAAWFALQLAAGIYLIHGRAGWFVVGAGRNGMEYSVLLIACLIVVALAYDTAYRPGARRSGAARATVLAVALLAASSAADAAAPRHRLAAPAGSAEAAAPPQVAFPGQYAPAPADWRYPVWPNGCNRFSGEDKVSCLQFVAADYGRRSRYAEANAALAPRRAGDKRVVFFGDSITDNWSKVGYGGFFPGRPYVNRGIGGQTTSQMLLRFRPDVIALKPDAVVILAGTNDIAGNAGPVSLEVVQQNLATMAEWARLHGIRVVLASLLPVSDDKRDGVGQPVVRTRDRPPATLRALNAWLAEYARGDGHVYLDYFSAVADGAGVLKGDLNDDGLHPNAAGYAVMAPLADKAIEAALAGRR
jgi:lysophospholipase L1-like esterase/uncharacterized membrane protein YphA (DoxX/SURF4 family)